MSNLSDFVGGGRRKFQDLGTNTGSLDIDVSKFNAFKIIQGGGTLDISLVGIGPEDSGKIDIILDQNADFDLRFNNVEIEDKSYFLNGDTFTFTDLRDKVIEVSLEPQSFSSSAEDLNAEAFDFSTDGTKLYILGSSNDRIFQYELTTPFDVSTATYSGNSFDVSAQATLGKDIAISEDGVKLFLIEDDGVLNSYNLSTPFLVSSASFDISRTLIAEPGVDLGSIRNVRIVKGGIFDGLIMYVSTVSEIFQYNFVSAPYDISQFSPRLFAKFKFGRIGGIVSFDLSKSGNYLYLYNTNDYLMRYKLSTRYDLSTTKYDGDIFPAFVSGGVRSVRVTNDGSNLHVLQTNENMNTFSLKSDNKYSIEYTPSSKIIKPFLDSDESSGKFIDLGTQTGIVDLDLNEFSSFKLVQGNGDITLNFIGRSSGAAGEGLMQFETNSDFNVNLTGAIPLDSGILYSGSQNAEYFLDLHKEQIFTDEDPNDQITRSVHISPDGLFLNVLYSNTVSGGNSRAYTLSAPFDVTSIRESGRFTENYNNTIIRPISITFNDDGSRVYLLDELNDVVEERICQAPYRLPGATLDKTFDIGGQAGTPLGIEFGRSGEKMYICDRTTERVYQYTLSTPFDISTASYDNTLFSFGTSEPYDIRFNSDGSLAYVLLETTIGTRSIREYRTKENFDVAGMYTTGTVINPVIPDLSSFMLSDNFTKLFALGATSTEGIVGPAAYKNVSSFDILYKLKNPKTQKIKYYGDIVSIETIPRDSNLEI